MPNTADRSTAVEQTIGCDIVPAQNGNRLKLLEGADGSERQQWLFRLPRCFGRRRVLALAALDDLEHAHQAELVAMRTRSHRCPTMTGGGSRWAAEKNPGTNVNNGGSFASDYSREGCLAGGPLLFPGKPLTLETSCD
jgi:hypothetical protein